MLNFEEKFRNERGAWLCDEIHQAIRERASLDLKIALVRSLYWGNKADLKSVPWEGASDIHLPVIFEKIENSVPKVVNAFWGTEPIVHVKRVPEEFMPEDTDNAERLLNWGLMEDICPTFYQTSEDWFRNTFRDGGSALKIYWKREWRKTVEVHRIKLLYDIGDTSVSGEPVEEARFKTETEILVEIFGKPDSQHGLLSAARTDDGLEDEEFGGHSWEIEFIEDRRRLFGNVKFRTSEFVDEIDVVVYRRILANDGPAVEVVEHDDLIVPFRTQDLQTADWVAQQFWLTKAEVKARYDDGTFTMTPEQYDRLIAKRPSQQDENKENEDLKRQKDAAIGEGTKDQRRRTATSADQKSEDDSTDKNRFLFYEVYLSDDIDQDNDPVEVVYTISYDLRSVVSSDYLDEVFPHGQRPFASLKYKSISDRYYGIGMGEVLVAINLEVNAIVNWVNNNQELINNPFFFYVPAATMVDPGIIKNVAPGDGIPIADPNGIVFPKFPQEPLANLQAMDTLLLFADRITISPMNAGSSQVRNAPRTARGTLAMLSEGNVQLDNVITRWQLTGWKELIHQLMGLYQAFMPDEKFYYVTGEHEPRRVTAQEIRGNWLYTFSGNTVNTNREVMRSIAQVRYNIVMTHPDYALDPNVRREALKDLLHHFSEGVDIDRLIPAMPGQGSYQHPPMAQSDENMAMLNGIMIDALPTDDHGGHLKDMGMFEGSAPFKNMPEDRVILFAMHKKMHMEMYAQQQSQAQQPVGPGQGNNVPSGMTQNQGTDLNALEGGVQ